MRGLSSMCLATPVWMEPLVCTAGKPQRCVLQFQLAQCTAHHHSKGILPRFDKITDNRLWHLLHGREGAQ